MLDYQGLLYNPIYDVIAQTATLSTAAGTSIGIAAVNKTARAPYTGFGVEFGAFKPTARVRMADIVAAGIVPADDLPGGEITLDGKAWSIKSYEYFPSGNGVSDGEIALILKDDLNA